MLSRLGAPGTGADGGRRYSAYASSSWRSSVAFVAAGQITAARAEESEGRLDHLLVRPVSRSRWFGGRLLVAVIVLLASGALAGVFAWLGAASQRRWVSFTTLVEAGVNLVPPAITILGIGALALGVWPRGTPIVVYALLAWSLLVVIIGGIGATSHWILDTSVFHQMASAPAVPPHWAANGVMVAISAASALIGGIAFEPTGPAGRMSTGQPDPPSPAISPPGGGAVAFEDLTARARIREAALRHFAEEGYERATIRVSPRPPACRPGCCDDHFGSKEELRKACDESRVRDAAPCQRTAPRQSGRHGQRPAHIEAVRAVYRARSGRRVCHGGTDLRRDGDPDRAMARPCRRSTARSARRGPEDQAALVTAMAAGIPLFHEHLSRTIGADIFGPEGDRLVALGLLDIYSHKLIDEETASAAEAGLDSPQG